MEQLRPFIEPLVEKLREYGPNVVAAIAILLAGWIVARILRGIIRRALNRAKVEPTLSGLHDFERIARLALRLGVPALLAVNKADLNNEVAGRLEEAAEALGIQPVGRVPYDAEVTQAQITAQSVVEASRGAAADAIRGVWGEVEGRLRAAGPSRVSGLVQVEVR